MYIRRSNVRTVVRLNSKLYDAARFTAAGLAHHDLFFADGATPTDDIVRQFLSICEKSDGAVAVHCKAGLGRTGTLVGCFLMKHFRLTAAEAIAWTRIARPGSVLGAQQQYLGDKQHEMWTQGDAYRRRRQERASEPGEPRAETPTPSTAIDEKAAAAAAAACSAPVEAPAAAATSQGDQLNRLKLQRCRHGQGQGHGPKLARENARRQQQQQQHQQEVNINPDNSLFTSYRRHMRSRN